MEPDKKEVETPDPELVTPDQPQPAPEQPPVAPDSSTLQAHHVQSHNQINNPTSKKPSRKRVILIILLAILLIIGSAAAIYFLVIKKDQPAATPKSTDANKSVSKEKSEPAPEEVDYLGECNKPGATAVKVTWSGKREKMADLKLFVDPSPETSPSEYYKVGVTDSKQAVIIAKVSPGTLEEASGVIIEDKTGHYIFLTRNQPEFYSVYKRSSAVELDSTKVIPELCVAKLEYKGQALTASIAPQDDHGQQFDTTKAIVLANYDFGTLYEYLYKDEPTYKMSQFMLVTKDTRIQQFYLPDVIVSNEANKYTPDITWNSGVKNTDGYSTKFRGCGASSAIELPKNLTEKDLVQIGKTGDGVIVYGFASTSNPLLKIHYEEYQDEAKSGSYDEPLNDGTKINKNMTIDEYTKLKPVIVAKNAIGSYTIYVNENFNQGGGCGKPVIYLYPEKTIRASVRVGARIVESIPSYGKGWTNVLAQPNGRLTVGGQQYGSLFWEGYGVGQYPDISGIGSVVAKENLRSTLISHLQQQGLNSTEQSEFMDFWWPRMPNTPYVRLTWLGTSSMNRLAPLLVEPRPDTVIRIFLDFEGLQKPIVLQPQRLSKPSRLGFTVVEWGGLIQGGLR